MEPILNLLLNGWGRFECGFDNLQAVEIIER
jgi:hypothetical protein